MAGDAFVLRSTTNVAAAWGHVIPASIRAESTQPTHASHTSSRQKCIYTLVSTDQKQFWFSSFNCWWALVSEFFFKECLSLKIEATTRPFDIPLIETWLLVIRFPMFIHVVILIATSWSRSFHSCWLHRVATVAYAAWSLSLNPRSMDPGKRGWKASDALRKPPASWDRAMEVVTNPTIVVTCCSYSKWFAIIWQCTTAYWICIFGPEVELLATETGPPRRSQRLCHSYQCILYLFFPSLSRAPGISVKSRWKHHLKTSCSSWWL